MKKIITTVIIALTLMTTNAQKKSNFEGTITFDISFEGSGLPKEALDMMKGAQSVTTIKGDHRRVDMNLKMQSTTAIIDSKSKNMVTLMDVMGTKYMIKMNEADLKKDADKTAPESIKYLDETKEIAGYKCKKAEITTKTGGKEETFTAYCTEEIPSSDLKSPYKGLKGFPLEYVVNQGGIKMTFSAKTVSKDPVADSKFDIPKEGYKETTMEDFQKDMSKMGGH